MNQCPLPPPQLSDLMEHLHSRQPKRHSVCACALEDMNKFGDSGSSTCAEQQELLATFSSIDCAHFVVVAAAGPSVGARAR